MAVGFVRHRPSKRNFKMVSFRVVSRSVLNHPFLMILLLSLIFLHRYFPFLFSLLVTVSPVLICTAVLLGTLLIHGKPNENDDVNYHEEVSYNSSSVTPRSGKEYHTYSTDREGMFSKDIFAEVRKDTIEKGVRSGSGLVGSGDRADSDLTDKNAEFSKGRQIHETRKGENDFGFFNFEIPNFETRFDQSYDKNFKVHEDVGFRDQFGSFLGQKKLKGEAVNHECSHCESDGAEKCSFDALVADVIPTAQETCPLLDSRDLLDDAPRDDSSVKFEFLSLDSNQSSEDSGDDENENEDQSPKHEDNGEDISRVWMEMEKNEHLESLITRTGDEDEMEDDEGTDDVDIDDEDVEDDDDEDDEEGENTDVERDVTKNVTMWTEEDEKNLRLVGNSELERDLRLENLLARRRVKRNFSMISERNLIDLDRPDHLLFQVPNISTRRVNPFDTPHDTTPGHFSSIPPIPGSAPSVSVPRKNPFDSPCTSPKKVPNLTEEIPEEKLVEMNEFYENGSSSSGYNHHSRNFLKPPFVEMNRKEAVFRRYDSFNTGYNFPGDDVSQSDFMETDRRDSQLKRRETFNARSTFSNILAPPKKLSFLKMKPVFVSEQAVRDQETRHSSLGRESSHDSESSISSSDSDIEDVGPSKNLEAHFEQNQDRDEITEDDHGSTHSDDSSSKSSEDDQASTHSEYDDLEEDFADSSLEVNAELNADQIFQKVETSHENHDDESSSNTSVISEVVHSSEKIAEDEDEDEDEIAKDSEFSPKASSNMSDSITEPPVFDSSPSGGEKVTPFSSSPSHTNAEV